MNSPRLETLLLSVLALAPAAARAAEPWQSLGLMRVRDMTPFGITRLDMLPAHAVDAEPGTFAVELNVSYQNTWAVSDNAEAYLAERGLERGEVGPADVAAILDLPGDAYLVDGEFGLTDLTLHYRAARRLGVYATVPYYTFDGGALDSTIEGFHQEAGFSSAGRELVPRDRFLVAAEIDATRVVFQGAPASEVGDPVLGVRYSLAPGERSRLVLEAAAKLAVFDRDRLVSTGENDYGAQVSWQRFFDRNALYLTLSAVYFESPLRGVERPAWIPTLIAGWEGRLAGGANFILQAAASESTARDTHLDELSATKLQVTAGVQWLWRGHFVRFGVTENVANFDNTPDVGVNLSLGRIFRPRQRGGDRS